LHPWMTGKVRIPIFESAAIG